MKFLCDEMFKGLARKLRTAGYDVVMEPDGTRDRMLIQRALAEGRLLLTRDCTLSEIRNAKQVVVLLESDGLEACVREVTKKLNVNWLFKPFSRCSLCNTLLIETDRPADFPPDVEAAFICPTCNKYYWRGAHVERMLGRLQRWQREFH
ncbi:MAG TPA: Mut7-C RNAse domain-containing protein [Methylophilaceae bacterium]|nr:Mut7-C RNAse domain-containing protein [Methylophilaceae bacterium]